ncbi:MAG: LCP family protein [Chloroflexi bacterium]|jgi:polyisoprenyl-teichoic acid--peptidoglycan teichoic acid transferase|nr:LCP family protein [Chloroflexota bacterium]MBT3669241.1 LCP family protein [Chloroflexota bacterium]MBT4003066.1 LCP family protein [Chloroflexota bacterium]MBT4305948.1 LCP family protein [Chloroflexota bacterium]MBT4532592.1 LCP family protein [Chloroflexota bacterium]
MENKRPKSPNNRSKSSSPDIVRKIALIGFAFAAIITAYFAFKFVREKTSSWNVTPLNGLAIPTPNIGADDEVEDGGSSPLISALQPPDWDGSSRVTILVVGLDYRDWEADSSAPRTDTMILLTFDPLTMSAGVLNIPRDLWVNIPNFGYGKINTAYQNGENAALPGGGPGLAMRTVEEFLGVSIDYFAQVDFNTFADFVDFYQGLPYVPTEDMVLEMIGTEARLFLYEGEKVTLSGPEAVAVARFRGSGGGDFDRSRRQQVLLLGMIDRITERYWLQYTLGHAGEIWDLFSNGIRTNMSLDEILGIGWKVKEIDPDSIVMRSISPPDMVQLAKSPEGLDILKPITQAIRVVRDEVFTSTAVVSPGEVGGEIENLMKGEAATVAVYNGTGIAGLASSTEEYLVNLGFNIVAVGNSENNGNTTLNVFTSKPFTMQYLSEIMEIPITNIFYLNDPSVTVDIEVIIGNDWSIP